ncbi:DUF4404 family protein [Limisphaera sp. VF-2]|uniref:DUF4404 family protein n=1 Tax=Limisphaera sp. VF-2 TaxID=3400418 RepID=UPI003C1785FB
MIEETIRRIEEHLQRAGGVAPDQKDQLLGLVQELKREIQTLSRTDQEAAQSIVGFTQVSAHEATRRQPDVRLVKLSLDGLRASVERFETSHPRLVQVVNHISQMLANLGI